MKENVYLYLIKLYNEEECFYKIGISVNKYSRFYQLMKFGYRCEIVYMLFGKDYLLFLDLENNMHVRFSKNRYLPIRKFGGYTECYKNIDVDNYIDALRDVYPIQADVIKNEEITWR